MYFAGRTETAMEQEYLLVTGGFDTPFATNAQGHLTTGVYFYCDFP